MHDIYERCLNWERLTTVLILARTHAEMRRRRITIEVPSDGRMRVKFSRLSAVGLVCWGIFRGGLVRWQLLTPRKFGPVSGDAVRWHLLCCIRTLKCCSFITHGRALSEDNIDAFRYYHLR